MPKVGKKEFSYSDKGIAEAKAYAKKTGQSIEKGSSPMAYESNDARNRSQIYKEGGKVKGVKTKVVEVKDYLDSDYYQHVHPSAMHPETQKARGKSREGASYKNKYSRNISKKKGRGY